MQQTPLTVVGYITTVLAGGQGASRPSCMNFARNVHACNNMPTNLHLLCGDGNLEPIAPAILGFANMQPIVQGQQPWVWVHSIIRKFIEDFSCVSEDNGRNVTVFIDTNTAFGVYTELAIVAADKLICPVNADDSSRTAASAMSILLHGSNPSRPVYGAWTFASKAAQYNIDIPLIHIFIGNRFTQYVGAATAFRAMSDATANQMYSLYLSNTAYLSPSNTPVNSVAEFRNAYSVFLRDFNTSGVVAAHTGSLLSNMRGGTYSVYGQDVPLDNRRKADCLNAIDDVIARL